MRESWLGDYKRYGDIVYIWHESRCVGCGTLLGCGCYVATENKPVEPNWPFEQIDCPLCDLRNRDENIIPKSTIPDPLLTVLKTSNTFNKLDYTTRNKIRVALLQRNKPAPLP